MKIKQFVISPENFVHMFVEGEDLADWRVWVTEGLPKDAELVEVQTIFAQITPNGRKIGGGVVVVVKSETFEDISAGQEIPTISIVMAKDRKNILHPARS